MIHYLVNISQSCLATCIIITFIIIHYTFLTLRKLQFYVETNDYKLTKHI